jgi:hypothetical protein
MEGETMDDDTYTADFLAQEAEYNREKRAAMGPKFQMRPDTQYDYYPGEELYHVFEVGRFNDFGEPYCVAPFLSFEEAVALVRKLNGAT